MSTIEIDKTYFETLLRRAELHGHIPGTVVLDETEHSELLRCKHEYNCLRVALHEGGVSPETLNLLIYGSLKSPEESTPDVPLAQDRHFYKSDTKPAHMVIEQNESWRRSPRDESVSAWSCDSAFYWSKRATKCDLARSPAPGNVRSNDFDGSTDVFPCRSKTKQSNIKRNQHTLRLAGLPAEATYKDITNVLCGGRLVDLWLQSKDRTATVTFAEGAAFFLAHSRRNDIYVGSKRIEVSWAERQPSMSKHLMNRLQSGASRNFVIRHAAGKLTEERIRSDMDHIHNLVIISVVWTGPDAYVSTNSINNAMFAKTCMMSRALYKGLRLDWYPDECAAAPGPNTPAPAQKEASASSEKFVVPTNRFNVLHIDNSDLDSENQSQDDSVTFGVDIGP